MPRTFPKRNLPGLLIVIANRSEKMLIVPLRVERDRLSISLPVNRLELLTWNFLRPNRPRLSAAQIEPKQRLLHALRRANVAENHQMRLCRTRQRVSHPVSILMHILRRAAIGRNRDDP